ncbi:hypothetical protein M758_UG256000 [Ceratodon purpureus]|nr:hypothetical protein M758_UG256000 [Ceratodon purpureus]
MQSGLFATIVHWSGAQLWDVYTWGDCDLRVYHSSMNVESCGCGYFGLSTCRLKCCVEIWEAGNNIQ